MSWRKRGLVFRRERAQLPVVSKIGNSFVCVYSERDAENKSYGSRFDFTIDNQRIRILREYSKFIEASDLHGSMDHAGCMPMQIINGLLFYIGWTLRHDIPYFNYTSVGEFEIEKEVKKLGPILAPDIIDAGFSGTIFILSQIIEGKYIGYYLSADQWLPDEEGNLQPSYDIKIAESEDLLKWHKTGKVAIPREVDEAGISASTVILHNGIYHMWFSARGSENFRGGAGAYEIKHAFSKDGVDWIRTNKFELKPELRFHENMCAYPSVFIVNDDLHLFYNSQNFGEGGISHAIMKLELLTEEQ